MGVTVIVAARTATGVSLAADSQTMIGNLWMQVEEPKLWVDNGFAFGAAGCKRTNQVLRYHVEWPLWDNGDWERFLVRQVVPAIFAAAEPHGVVKRELGQYWLESRLIIATEQKLAAIGGNGCVFVPVTGVAAIGSGDAQALGYLGGRGPFREWEVIGAALRASESAVGVDSKISVVSTSDLEVRVG